MPQIQGAPAQQQAPEQVTEQVPGQAPEQESEEQVIDQIGILLQKLSPERQKSLVGQLGEMMGAAEQPQGIADAEAGVNGVPVENA